jgi:hypothetical protein
LHEWEGSGEYDCWRKALADLHVLHAQVLKNAEQIVDERVVEGTVATTDAAAAAAAVPGRSVRIASFQQSALNPRSAAHLPAHQHGTSTTQMKAKQKACCK